jgi:hypothetical protein
MCLLAARVAAWLRLSQREEAWKTAEILILRHQLAILQRQQPRRPKPNWADRALIATLLGVMRRTRRHGLRLLVTPDTILRWTATSSAAAGPPGPCTARPAARPPAGTSRPWSAGWLARIPSGVPKNPRRAGRTRIKVAASTVWEILRASGIDPAGRRTGPTWSQFLRSQADAVCTRQGSGLRSTRAPPAASGSRGGTSRPAGIWTWSRRANPSTTFGRSEHPPRHFSAPASSYGGSPISKSRLGRMSDGSRRIRSSLLRCRSGSAARRYACRSRALSSSFRTLRALANRGCLICSDR